MNSPPAILAVRSNDSGELAEPGPVSFEDGAGTMTVDVIDTDVTDTLTIRVFVDYTIDNTTAPRVDCTVPANGEPTRTATCSTNALCLKEQGDIGARRNMQIYVFDRRPEENGDPAFQKMPVGGLSTNRFYFLECVESPP